MIHAETCTAFLCLLVEIFGTNPENDELSGVAIDRGIIESNKQAYSKWQFSKSGSSFNY